MTPSPETQLDRSLIEDISNPLRKRFLFFKANYRHFFGCPENGDYWPLFKKHLTYKKQAPANYLPENLRHTMNNYRVIDESGSFKMATEKAVMISSFHYGAYNLLAAILTKEDVRFAVLANGAIYRQQLLACHKERTEKKEGKAFSPALNDSDIINPRDFTTMIKMMHKVREGKSLLVYADGLEGQGGYMARERLETVPFLDKHIYARRGTASLAYTLKIPIVIAMIERDEAGFVARSFPALDPADYAGKEAFITAYCRIGYQILEDYVRQAPELWEIFDRLHIWLPAMETPQKIKHAQAHRQSPLPHWYRFDQDRFDIFVEAGKTYLLDEQRREVIAITKGMSQFLPRISGVSHEVIAGILPEDLLQDLFNREVLVADQPPVAKLAA